MTEFFHSFTFANPWWLIGLFFLIPLFFLRGSLGSPHSITYSSLSILVGLGEKPKRYLGAISLANIGFILALASAIIALARPQLHNEYTDRNISGIDIILAVDISYSMEISDFVINNRRAKRITAAKVAAESFINERANDRIGIIAFSGRPYVTSPITLEHEWLVSKLHELKPGIVEEQGTAIGSAIAASATRLNEREAKSKIIILVTDGANNSGKIAPIEAAKHANKLGIKIYTVAIGTESGRLSRTIQSRTRQEFDTGPLEEIAKLTGGEFFRVKSTGSLVDTFASIDDLEKTEIKQQTIVDIEELFHWFTAASFILALLAIVSQALNPAPAPQ